VPTRTGFHRNSLGNLKRFLVFTISILFSIQLNLFAEPKLITIYLPQPLHPFGITDDILLAFVKVESNFDKYAENPITKARGILQITQVMIDEANRIVGWQKYTWDDAWSPEKSIEIWYLVQNYFNPEYGIQKAAQIWFGVGVQYDGLTWERYYAMLKF